MNLPSSSHACEKIIILVVQTNQPHIPLLPIDTTNAIRTNKRRIIAAVVVITITISISITTATLIRLTLAITVITLALRLTLADVVFLFFVFLFFFLILKLIDGLQIIGRGNPSGSFEVSCLLGILFDVMRMP